LIGEHRATVDHRPARFDKQREPSRLRIVRQERPQPPTMEAQDIEQRPSIGTIVFY